ncbi:MAG: hypothetical protein HKP21_03405 [Xanthomonadales bacterium]|nr:hypothetical protein [Gammaproteobacteria bacterium]NNK03577.1 hypothetical protein [Xanthomonadales bacterium]
MITDNQDQSLKLVFAEARQDLDGEALTNQVMAKTRRVLVLLAAGVLSIAILLVGGAWLMFGMPLLDFAVLISQFLTITLFDLGEGWLALVFTPLNNIASLVIIGAKAVHLGWKKLLGASFSN